MSNYAIYDKHGVQVTDAKRSKTEAWNTFRMEREDWRTFMRDADIARYRKLGFYADDAYDDLNVVEKAKPQPKADKTVYIKYNGHEVELTFDVMANIENFYNSKSEGDTVYVHFDDFVKAVKLAVLIDGDDL